MEVGGEESNEAGKRSGSNAAVPECGEPGYEQDAFARLCDDLGDGRVPQSLRMLLFLPLLCVGVAAGP